jgi:hypothetical protein
MTSVFGQASYTSEVAYVTTVQYLECVCLSADCRCRSTRPHPFATVATECGETSEYINISVYSNGLLNPPQLISHRFLPTNILLALMLIRNSSRPYCVSKDPSLSPVPCTHTTRFKPTFIDPEIGSAQIYSSTCGQGMRGRKYALILKLMR